MKWVHGILGAGSLVVSVILLAQGRVVIALVVFLYSGFELLVARFAFE